MATADSTAPVNGTYGTYEVNNQAAANANSASSYGAVQQQQEQMSSGNSSELPKEEIGWYFVEQYYTTLSKNPERLYLYYNKRSQFVSGTEEEKAPVCHGQKSINDRIKELDFHDTKVRVTNVDSQGSDDNIVIQVIGQISNKGEPHKRFVQTFVLAAQTHGYFLLNDIFRYLADETEEEEAPQDQQEPIPSGIVEPAPTAAEPTEPVKHEAVGESEENLAKVDQKLEEVAHEEPAVVAPAPEVNGSPAAEVAEPPVAAAEESPAVAPEEAPAAQTEAPAKEAAEPEKPAEPAPTPAPEAPKPAAAATPAAAPKPAVPRTWASLAASAHKVATPAVPAPTAQPGQPQAKAPAPAASQAPAAPAEKPAPAREPSPSTSQGEAAGWQSVTGHKKEQSRSQAQPPAADGENKRAYIKNVYSQVEEGPLKAALSKFGEITYLDISRQKNCAFVDFKTLAGFQAAVSNNPHRVNGVDLTVEERRMRPQGFAPYSRGGSQRGRGGMGQQAPRGSFNPRGGRGGAGGRGGRPQPQEVA
ncbi:uncharacterized protein EI97DRAFT_149472 [Westerdykella ornata]|uniref:NTF2-domain-containing protein n=1 Tax=Westerdykella ornata TaxID=318751 RepID=A0A6A6JB83_WESOR|nr:uncharacterized protein EI97DRAFT_149472 [Westerdykella ornata]KAF2273682.1 hypothetical protein EI97DRAFT_149472 [Westerdykella ornata]